jgi:asparagine synthetase B (glutamine-hydrolysing)
VRTAPCCVAFSGGRDSSLVLAAAVRAAHEEGVPAPLALTHRFPEIDATREDEWQELVLDHLGVEQRIFEAEDLDLVGSVAGSELLRRGVLFPPNIHLLTPLLRAARGGTLLIGIGGDEFLGDQRFEQLNNMLAGRRRPSLRDAPRLGVALLPPGPRGRVLRHLQHPTRPWLQPAARRPVRLLEAGAAAVPVRFDHAIVRTARARYLEVAYQSARSVGAAAGVAVEAPLFDVRFLFALARAGGARGWGSRAATMHAVAGDMLPDKLLARRSKAIFDRVFVGEAAQRFADEWSGEGLDPAIVDGEALRRAWRECDQPFRTATLMQLAWLHDHSPAGA